MPAEQADDPSPRDSTEPSEPGDSAEQSDSGEPGDSAHPSGNAEPASRGVWSAIKTGLVGGVLVLLVAIAAAVIVVPALTGSTALTVLTSSMEPSLPPGTMIVVKPTPIDDINPGMVLTYQLVSGEPTLVTHRVVQRQQLADGTPVFITQGDANPQPDPDPVKEVQIKGTVWYAIPYIGWVTTLLTGENRALVVTIVIGLLLAYAAWMAFSGVRERGRAKPAAETA